MAEIKKDSMWMALGLRLGSACVRSLPSSRTVKPFFVRRSSQLSRFRFDFNFRTRIQGVTWSARAFPDILTRHLLFEGRYQEDVILAIRALTPKGGIVFDVGGHHGLMAIVAARAVGPNGRVFTFEPNPLSRRELEANLQLNRIQNVVMENRALSDRAGQVPFYIQRGTASWNSTLFKELIAPGYAVETVTVPTETMDEYVQRMGIVPDVVKVDVEGAEFLVLRGAERVIREHRPILIMEFNPEAAHAANTTIGAIVDLLHSRKYRLVTLKKNRWGRYQFHRQEAFVESRHCGDDLANVICIPCHGRESCI